MRGLWPNRMKFVRRTGTIPSASRGRETVGRPWAEALLPPAARLTVRWDLWDLPNGVNPTGCPLTHTYCALCLAKAQDMVRTLFPEIGA